MRTKGLFSESSSVPISQNCPSALWRRSSCTATISNSPPRVAPSQCRCEGDVESSDGPHEGDSPIEERPQPHADRARRHDLGDVTPCPPLRGFGSSQKVLPTPPPPFQLHHSAPYVLPTLVASVLSSVPAPSETAPMVVTATPFPPPPPLCLVLASALLLRPVRSFPLMWVHPCGHTHARHSTSATILSSTSG